MADVFQLPNRFVEDEQARRNFEYTEAFMNQSRGLETVITDHLKVASLDVDQGATISGGAVQIDSSGITVGYGDFRLTEQDSPLINSVLGANRNMLRNHSFEIAEDIDVADLLNWNHTAAVSPGLVDDSASGSFPTPLFGYVAAVASDSTVGAWEQYAFLRQDVPSGPYALSAYFAQNDDSPAAGTSAYRLRMQFGYFDSSTLDWVDVGSELVATHAVTWSTASRYQWVRVLLAATSVPSNGIQATDMVKVSIDLLGGSATDTAIVDGVQLVPGADPMVYEPENAVWLHATDAEAHAGATSLDVRVGPAASASSATVTNATSNAQGTILSVLGWTAPADGVLWLNSSAAVQKTAGGTGAFAYTSLQVKRASDGVLVAASSSALDQSQAHYHNVSNPLSASVEAGVAYNIYLYLYPPNSTATSYAVQQPRISSIFFGTNLL